MIHTHSEEEITSLVHHDRHKIS